MGDVSKDWRLGCGLLLALAAVIAGALVYAATREPEVIHDLKGAAWYRLRGDDSFQQSIEACYALDKRVMVPGFIAPGIPSDPNEAVFCCGRRPSADAGVTCDKPIGNEPAPGR